MKIEESEFVIPTMKVELNAKEVRALLAIMKEYLESENVAEKSMNGWVEKEIGSMFKTLDNAFYCFLAEIKEASGGTGIYIRDEHVLNAFRHKGIGYSDSDTLRKLLEDK